VIWGTNRCPWTMGLRHYRAAILHLVALCPYLALSFARCWTTRLRRLIIDKAKIGPIDSNHPTNLFLPRLFRCMLRRLLRPGLSVFLCFFAVWSLRAAQDSNRFVQTQVDSRDPAPLDLPPATYLKDTSGEDDLPKAEPLKLSKSFDLRTDLRIAYEQVAGAYGLNVSFDSDLPARDVRFKLDDVDFDTAMKALTAETSTFWHALNSKLILVSANTVEKHKAYDPLVEKTFALTASVDSAEMTELVRVIRELTGAQHLQQSVANHSISIRDCVQRIKLAEALIRELEHAPGEVLLEIDLLEVDRSTATKLGITPPGSVHVYSLSSSMIKQLRSATDFTSLLTLLAKVFGTSVLTSIPPVAPIGGGKTLFLLGLPSISADFSETLSLARSGRQVLLRAQNGRASTFFVGERYPVTLSLLSSALGSTGSTSNSANSSSEQFDVGAGPVALATADFRAIGLQDLTVLNELDNAITVLLNQGSGATSQFSQATGSPISLGRPRTSVPAIPSALATGNLNPLPTGNNPIAGGDNLPDLLVTDPVANNVTVLLQTSAANGTFLPPKNPISVGKQPSAIATGTFNSDNDTNVGFVVTNFADNTFSVFNGNGDGTFTEVQGSPFALPRDQAGPSAITVADFNSDGKLDLAILNRTSKSVTILEGRGDGTFQEFPGSPLAVGNFPVAIASGSLSGSSGPALAVVNQGDNTVSVFLGNGDGTFAAASQSPLATSATPSGVVIADFLQQSDGGIAVSNSGSGTVTVFLDLGSGTFETALEPAAGSNPGAIVAADFTNSAFPDIVVANNNNEIAVHGQVTLLVSPANQIPGAGNGQQPYPGSQYEDIGLKVNATPNLHDDGEVTIKMECEIRALAGTNLNGIPIIANRTLSQTVRLKENETSLIGGLLNQQGAETIAGLPRFAEIPGLDYVFGTHDDSASDTELLILVTPRRIRLPWHDARSIYAGRGDIGGRASLGDNTALPPEDQPQVPSQTPEAPPQPAPTPGQPDQRAIPPNPPAPQLRRVPF
jgi:Bacterial type II and III secretion system protein/FG-GAP-like repeat